MTRISRFALAASLLTSGIAFATPPAKPAPTAPAEVMAAAPAGTTLLGFKTSGDQSNADAVAVFQSAPDKNGSQFRSMVVFGKKDGKFVPDFTNDKMIACSNCDQYHLDSFDMRSVDVKPGRVHIDQFDSGEKASTTSIDLAKKDGAWRVTKATRESYYLGDGPAKNETLPLPASGLAKDMDGKWIYVAYVNTIMIHKATGTFNFLHQDTSPEAVWKHAAGDCNKEDCAVLVQQGDGCISLVKDSAGRPFGAGTPDPKNEKAALSKALEACSAAGGSGCKEVRTDCTRGVF